MKTTNHNDIWKQVRNYKRRQEMIAEADKTSLSGIVVVSDGDSGNQNDEQMKIFANEMPRLHMLKCIFRNIICADRGHILVHIQHTQDLSIHRCKFCDEIIVHDKTKAKKPVRSS